MGDVTRKFHVNMLKPYNEPGPEHLTPAHQPYQSEDTIIDSHKEEADMDQHLTIGTALAIEDDSSNAAASRDPTIPTGQQEAYGDCNLAPDLTAEQRLSMLNLLQNYQDLLTDIPNVTNVLEHHIDLIHDKPIKHSYPLPYSLHKQLKDDLQKWKNLGIVEQSTSPYCSPLLAVRKKDGTHRFCLDCRQLNRITKPDLEPIADPNEIFQKLTNASYLSKLDLTSGFWQVPLGEKSRPYTAFTTNFGHYQFRTMPFGLVGAPACFSRLMREVLKGLDFLDAFMDDIIVFSASFEDHLMHLEELFKRLKNARLHVKPSKCLLGFQSLEYLGHIVGHGSCSPMEDKVAAIRETPFPSTLKELLSFLGSLGYYQRFIKSYAELTAPLTNLLRGRSGDNSRLTWNESAIAAFHKLREALTCHPVLQLPDLSLPFTLRTDASENGVGAVLCQPSQHDSRILCPVFYASKKFRDAQTRYSTVEKEAYAIFWAVQKFERYLYGRCFTIETDHQPLLYLQSADRLNPRIKRWAIYLSFFRFFVKHIEGKDNNLADYMSRIPHEVDLCESTFIGGKV